MKLGVIGCGNMSKAILRGVINGGVIASNDIYVRDQSEKSSDAAAQDLGVESCYDLAQLIESCSVVLIGVKPNTVVQILSEVSKLGLPAADTLFVSIAAGVSLNKILENLPEASKAIRTMPNTPVLVGEGVLAYTPSETCDMADEEVISQLFSCSATVSKVPEVQMDVITGLTGSGPAYVFSFIESLADGALKEGLPRDQALELAAKMVLGSAKMVLETKEHPAILRDRVSSPGGTTIAGTATLEQFGFRNAVISAVGAATAKSKELG